MFSRARKEPVLVHLRSLRFLAIAMDLLKGCKYGSVFSFWFCSFFHLVCAQKSPPQVIVSSPRISKGALVTLLVLAIIVAAVILYEIVAIILNVRRKYYRNTQEQHHSSRIPININGVRSFTSEEVISAIRNSGQSIIGEGGYGKVYKGIIVDGTVVAIKRAKKESQQGVNEFLNEITLLSRLHHCNLLSLIGYCCDEGEQTLIYEFMENGSLEDLLFDYSKEPLNFIQRVSIALGSAMGLRYLHEEISPSVIHRDVKASNILLGLRLMPKVSDFGLSRLGPVPDTEGNVAAHVSTDPKGTPGYIDPEYWSTRTLTPKSDVYSLGVVFLELLTGRNSILNHQNLVSQVNLARQSRLQFSLIDKRMGPYPDDCMMRFLTLALNCCKHLSQERPNMSEVVRELQDIHSMMLESNARNLRD